MANRRRRRTGCVPFVFLAILAVVAGAAFAFWRGAGPLPDPPGCVATVDGRSVELDPGQSQNAALIAAISIKRGLPARAASIALATAYQESKIRNLDHGDRDSLGLFQQRPSQGWGTPAEIRNVHYAINKFYEALEKIDGYQEMRITEAAQRVQRSAFPEAYEDHAPDGRTLASALTGFSGDGSFTCVVRSSEDPGTAAGVIESLRKAYGETGAARTGSRQDVAVAVNGDEAGNRRGWSVASYLVAHADELKIRSVRFDGLTWQDGRDSEDGWVESNASGGRVVVSLG